MRHCREPQQFVKIIFRIGFITHCFPAFLAAVCNGVLVSPYLNNGRFHHSTTLGKPISWSFLIDMLTPKAFRTVVGVASSLYFRSALLTYKIFPSPNELFARFRLFLCCFSFRRIHFRIKHYSPYDYDYNYLSSKFSSDPSATQKPSWEI